MKRLTIFSLLLLSVTMLFAQQMITVNGQVTDDQNLGLPGITIQVKGTQQGTITDLDGNYSIEVPSNATLIFRYLGFLTQEIALDGRTTVNVQMNEDIIGLEEVVVVGYGELRVKDLT